MHMYMHIWVCVCKYATQSVVGIHAECAKTSAQCVWSKWESLSRLLLVRWCDASGRITTNGSILKQWVLLLVVPDVFCHTWSAFLPNSWYLGHIFDLIPMLTNKKSCFTVKTIIFTQIVFLQVEPGKPGAEVSKKKNYKSKK